MELADDTSQVDLITNHTDQPPEPYLTEFELPSESDSTMQFSSGSSYNTMSTLGSEQASEYFRSVYGVIFPSDVNIPLVWPADSTADRLDVLLHVVIRLCQNGMNVPIPVDQMLASSGVNSTEARVLDILTNSGTWVNEMASMYLAANFVSIDVKPLVAHQPHSRINYQVYDFYAGIAEPDACFDLVHVRQGLLVTKDFNFLLREMHRVLKPNGYLLIYELPVQMYEGVDPDVRLHSAPLGAEGLRLVRAAWQSQGVDIAAWDDMATRLDPRHPLWDNQPPTQHALQPDKDAPSILIQGFHTISLHTMPVPVGTWPSDESQRIVGSLMRLMSGHSWRSLLPILLLTGMEETQAKVFADALMEEFIDIDSYRAYLRCHVWSARRI